MRLLARDILKRGLALLLSMLIAFEPVAFAQPEATPLPPAPSAQAQPAFSQQELDQMLAPIALYPDPLLSQILMASTYPLEIVEAARWSRANPLLKGDDAVRAVQQHEWDPSVKSLVAFPQILQMMDEKLNWTERLGDAFLAQEAQVMDTVQGLRQRAYAAGNLRSNDQINVVHEGQTIAVEPAAPDVVYVPYYDPNVIYGAWWWDDYPPIFWAPWPGYYFGPGFSWGIGIIITSGFFFGHCDWHHHRVTVVNVKNFYYHPAEPHEILAPPPPGGRNPIIWRHDPGHRHGVPYRGPALRQQYGRPLPSPGARREFRGYIFQPSPKEREGDRLRRPERGPAPIVPSLNAPIVHSLPGSIVGSPAGVPPTRAPEPREIRPHAFEGIGRGSEVRNYSVRGHSSQENSIRGQGEAPRPTGQAGSRRTQHPR